MLVWEKMLKFAPEKHYDLHYDLRITRRVEAFRSTTQTRYGIIPTLITTFGLEKGMYADAIHATVTMEQLFDR